MTAPRFVDTNILLYSISRDPAESAKRDIAIAMLDEEDLVLSVQVLQEFYVQATRSTRLDALTHDIAVGLIRTWLRFEVQGEKEPMTLEPTLNLLMHADGRKRQAAAKQAPPDRAALTPSGPPR